MACISGAIMYDIFIYTGESPINKPGLGLLHLLSKVCGAHDDEPKEDEEKGKATESPPISDSTQVGEEEGDLQDNDDQPEVKGGVEQKADPYDQPQNSQQGSRQAPVRSYENKFQKKKSKDTSYDDASRRRNKHQGYDDPSGS